ncbi:AraC family transcriptional regulator [Streptomyces sp. NPDC001292]|uniref:AraC family transcriptional regulator n=1 Tax=Streptomyces sp. NPDC001292 TaxID=3364558 RepID=UPI0036A8BEF2
MSGTVDLLESLGLERSCTTSRDSIRFGQGFRGIDRAEVRLAVHAFGPHRHDDYAIGITTAGVQKFKYRGGIHFCVPGQMHILHPDEEHDGGPGTDEGFAYRIFYIAAEAIRAALGDKELPFVSEPVQDPVGQLCSIKSWLADIDDPIRDLSHVDITAIIADSLATLAHPSKVMNYGFIDIRAVDLAREYLSAHACEQTSAATLEQITGQDRYTLSRQFRRAFGTSPDRYRTLRRVALARKAIELGEPIAQVATETGFADQSHLTRQFKRTYGITPAIWASLTQNAAA